jgi:hypothetical protein
MAAAEAQPNILKWPRMQANDFGCYLEQTFGVKDKKFNCSLKRYVNRGDACKRVEAYHEGPVFPRAVAGRIHPAVKDVELSWEHGQLQSLSLTFDRTLSRGEIVKLFALPKSFSYPKEYPNVMSIDIQECSLKANCLVIDGFEHMGAGDVDCGDGK